MADLLELTPEQRWPLFAEEWASALESGEYEQAKETLYDGIGYCCLGVACELLRKNHADLLEDTDVSVEYVEDRDTTAGMFVKYNGFGLAREFTTGSLPSLLVKELGIPDASGSLHESPVRFAGYTLSLANMNDGGDSFKDIAAVIRRNAPAEVSARD